MVNDNDNFMIVARVAEIGTRVIFENQFGAETFLQMSGGPIGDE